MAARVTRLAHPAGLAAPDQETREQGLRALRLELEQQKDPGLAALLEYEVAGLHERREDLASAARDFLAATKRAAGFVEPLETLVEIALRSRSKANLTKLLDRLRKLAKTSDETARAGLGLALTHLASDDHRAAAEVIEQTLDQVPDDPALWLALETSAAHLGDRDLLLKAATGRAAHARSTEMRCLLLERIARLQMEAGDKEAALASLRQSVDELPSWRALRAWEELARRSRDFQEVTRAAIQTATIIRAGLEEPEEAELYQIPKAELTTVSAISAQVRALVAALRSDDAEEARGLAEQLAEASPKHALCFSLLLELCRVQGDVAGAFSAATRLMEAGPPSSEGTWDESSRTSLLSLVVVTAARAGLHDESRAALEELGRIAPEARLPQLHHWLDAEGEAQRLIELLHEWTDAPSSSKDGAKKRSLSLARALLQFAQGDLDAVEKSISEVPTDESASPSRLASVLAWAAQSARSGLPTSKNGALSSDWMTSPADQRALGWESVRCAWLTRETESLSLPAGITDPWAELSFRLLARAQTPTEVAGATESDAETSVNSATPSLPVPPPSVADAIARYVTQGQPTDELAHALFCLSVAQSGDTEKLAQRYRENPGDPFWAGAYIRHLQLSRSPDLTETRVAAAEHLQDENLRAGWLLKSAFDCLAVGNLERATELLALAHPSSPEVVDRLQRWFCVAKTHGDPKAVFESLRRGQNQTGRALLHGALMHRFARDEFLDEPLPDRPPALDILRAMAASVGAPERLDAILDDSDVLSDAQAAQLAFATKLPLESGDALLKRTGRLLETERSTTNLLAHWVSSARAGDDAAQARCLAELGLSLGSKEILVGVSLSSLAPETRTSHLEQLGELAKTTHTEDDDGNRAIARRGAILARWSLLEHETSVTAPETARLLHAFADTLDASLHDLDAQNSALLSGFGALLENDDERALQLFERLYAIIPDDLTLCRGVRIVAHRTGRADLEAPVLRTLARVEESGAIAADLWERAGLLYEDILERPGEAEDCYNNALGRRPGSRVAFERVYRFARSKKDRPRMVELLDARIDSADSETLLIELYWEKARYCRMLGRRQVALRALQDLLALAPGHLPSLALSAELHLVDGQLETAASLLAEVARHPDTPEGERRSSGLFACDIFEQQKRHQDAVELLQFLDNLGLTGGAGLERRARSLARTEDWGAAYHAFAELNREQDDLDARLQSAQMMLAIQRDHLRDPEEMKLSARSVLRDAPTDPDAVRMVLELSFHADERRRLLTSARDQLRGNLRNTPLDPEGIAHFADLCEDCGDDRLERISLGILALSGKLSDEREGRLLELGARTQALPSAPFSRADIESIADPLQLGSAGKYIRLVAPYLAVELDPTLDALGVSSLMRMDEFSGAVQRAEIGTWMGAFGGSDFELYVGGNDPHVIRGIHGDLSTFLVGQDVPFPLEPPDRARMVSQLFALHHSTVTLVNHPAEELEKWLRASEILAGGLASEGDPEVDEMARSLAKNIPRQVRDEMSKLYTELSRASVQLSQSVYAVMRGCARAAVLAHGEPSILRQLPELLPSNQEMLDVQMADIIRFSLSDAFETLRRKVGLEGA